MMKVNISINYLNYFRYVKIICVDRTRKIPVVWEGYYNLKCVLIVFVIPNLSLIYFCMSEVFRLVLKPDG